MVGLGVEGSRQSLRFLTHLCNTHFILLEVKERQRLKGRLSAEWERCSHLGVKEERKRKETESVRRGSEGSGRQWERKAESQRK